MNEKRLGATGKFPEGKINEADEGGLNIGVATTEEGKIIVKFGTPVSWIGFDNKEAVQFANLLIRASLELKNG